MIVPININSGDLMSQFNISKKEVEDVMDFVIKEVTSEFAQTWEEVAMRELKSSKMRYVSNLSVIDTGRLSGAVILDYSKDPLVRSIEEGMSPLDMKLGFQNSSKKKMKKDGGWYLTIPMKWATPDSIAESSTFSGKMPKQIYSIVKNKEVNQPLRKGEIPTEFAVPKTRAEIPKSKSFETYQHKNSIYEGITKTKDSVTGSTSYNSFRRVSNNSDSNSWIHPGIEAKNIGDKAFQEFESKIEVVLQEAMDNSLKFLGFE